MVKKIHSQAVTFWIWRLYTEYVVDRHPKRYSPMSMVGRGMLEGYKCERCGHIWIPRKYQFKKRTNNLS
jgi:hypothetical protein